MLILLVDDDEFILDAFSEIIRHIRPEIRPIKASSAADAITYINQYREQIKVILSDIKMPGEDGFILKKTLNQMDIKIPFVFVSAMPILTYKLVAKQLGAIGFLSKPVRGSELVEAIDRAIEYTSITKAKPELLNAVAELVISQTDSKPIVKQLSEDYTVGRSENADIRLVSSKASREHAVLNRTKESYLENDVEHHYRIVDLSKNGFNVNGKRAIGYYLLKHGDSIELPDCSMKYFVLLREITEGSKSTYA